MLVDAPPVELEVEFDVEVYFPKQNVYRRLGEVSPVVRTLAREQFDDYVKRVRVFVHPRLAAELERLPNLAERLGGSGWRVGDETLRGRLLAATRSDSEAERV